MKYQDHFLTTYASSASNRRVAINPAITTHHIGLAIGMTIIFWARGGMTHPPSCQIGLISTSSPPISRIPTSLAHLTAPNERQKPMMDDT